MEANKLISEELFFNVEFYDVDSMKIVWHGNYVKYMEKARCRLLDKIGFNYLRMEEIGVAFPIVEIKFKYIRSLHFGEKVRALATLEEWENRLKISYEFYNAESGLLTTKASSTQMAVNKKTGETMFVCPQELIDKVENYVEEK